MNGVRSLGQIFSWEKGCLNGYALIAPICRHLAYVHEAILFSCNSQRRVWAEAREGLAKASP
jgi:hypothetical protein